MKRARIMLAALTVLTIAGSAFVVKAQKIYGSIVYTTSTATTATSPLVDHTITTGPGGGAFQTYATTVPGGVAKLTWVKPQQ